MGFDDQDAMFPADNAPISPRISSIRRGSFPNLRRPRHGRVEDGFNESSTMMRPSALDTTFCATTKISRAGHGNSLVFTAERMACSSTSPKAISGCREVRISEFHRVHAIFCASCADSFRAMLTSSPRRLLTVPKAALLLAPSGWTMIFHDGIADQGFVRPVTRWIGAGGGWLLERVVTGLTATGITPNMFTFLGLAVNLGAAVLFGRGQFRLAAAALFLAGFLDMADGQVARRAGRVTAFGGFYDSTLDRYSDLGPLYGAGGLLHSRGQHVLRRAGGRRHGQFVYGELHARSRRITDSHLQSRLHGAARASGAAHSGRRISTAWRRCCG